MAKELSEFWQNALRRGNDSTPVVRLATPRLMERTGAGLRTVYARAARHLRRLETVARRNRDWKDPDLQGGLTA